MNRDRDLEVPRDLLERLPAELLARMPADWPEAKDEREAAAVSWRWAKNPTGDEALSPLDVERFGYRPGRRRRPPAPERTGLGLYGYDEHGRAVIAVQRGGDGTETQATLLWHGERESVAVIATPARRSRTAPEGWWPPSLQRVERAELEGGGPIRIEHFRPNGVSLERCRWEGERLVEATVEQTDRPGVDHRDVFDWQGSDLVLIERHSRQGESSVVYQRMPRGVTLAGLLSALEDDLIERIPVAVAELGQREPICAAALAYCLGELSLPPAIVLCPDAVRRRLPTEGEDGFWYRWQAAEWTSAAEVPELDSYGDEEFRKRCDVVSRQVLLDGDDRLTARLLQAVARRLNRIDWGDLVPVTDDFLIYAWEIHGDSLEEDLAASVPGGEAPSEVGPAE